MGDKKEEKGNAQLTIRLSPAIKEGLELMAEYEDRSLNKQVVSILREQVNKFNREYRNKDTTGDLPIN